MICINCVLKKVNAGKRLQELRKGINGPGGPGGLPGLLKPLDLSSLSDLVLRSFRIYLL